MQASSDSSRNQFCKLLKPPVFNSRWATTRDLASLTSMATSMITTKSKMKREKWIHKQCQWNHSWQTSWHFPTMAWSGSENQTFPQTPNTSHCRMTTWFKCLVTPWHALRRTLLRGFWLKALIPTSSTQTSQSHQVLIPSWSVGSHFWFPFCLANPQKTTKFAGRKFFRFLVHFLEGLPAEISRKHKWHVRRSFKWLLCCNQRIDGCAVTKHHNFWHSIGVILCLLHCSFWEVKIQGFTESFRGQRREGRFVQKPSEGAVQCSSWTVWCVQNMFPKVHDIVPQSSRVVALTSQSQKSPIAVPSLQVTKPKKRPWWNFPETMCQCFARTPTHRKMWENKSNRLQSSQQWGWERWLNTHGKYATCSPWTGGLCWQVWSQRQQKKKSGSQGSPLQRKKEVMAGHQTQLISSCQEKNGKQQRFCGSELVLCEDKWRKSHKHLQVWLRPDSPLSAGRTVGAGGQVSDSSIGQQSRSSEVFTTFEERWRCIGKRGHLWSGCGKCKSCCTSQLVGWDRESLLWIF